MEEAKTTAAPPSFLRRLVALDTKISGEIHMIAKPFLPHFLLLLLEISADFRLFFPVALSLLLVQGASNSSFLWPLILGLLLDLALIGLIKFIVRRARPVYNKNMTAAVSVDHFSFPSGHASRVCFVASLVYLSAATDHATVLVSAVCAWAAATSISRILLGRHFVFDVFAGACLGVLEGQVSFHFLRF